MADMAYRMMGAAHARALGLRLAAGDGERGQGTVEYVGLILLIAGVIAAVVTVGGHWDGQHLAKTIVGKLETAIDGVGGSGAAGG
jgi:hypothetical protein